MEMSLFRRLPGCPRGILLLDYFLIYSADLKSSGDHQEAANSRIRK